MTALVKSTGDVTVGIGDGANDVGMIQEAHIGESPLPPQISAAGLEKKVRCSPSCWSVQPCDSICSCLKAVGHPI